MDEILPGLWLGPKWATNYKKAFERIGITHILSMGDEAMQTPEGRTLKYVGIRDTASSNLLAELPDCV